MRYKVLFFLTVVCLCFVFSFNCFAYSLDNNYPGYTGNAHSDVDLVTPSEMLGYINDYSVGFVTESGSITNVVFYVSNMTLLETKIHEYYQINGGTMSFAKYINFDINYQSFSILLQPGVTSNYNNFVSYINLLADTYVTNQTLIHNLEITVSDYNTLQSSYQSLLNAYNSLGDDFENLDITYNQLVDNYNLLVAEKNALSYQYSLLQSDYDVLLGTYNSSLDEIDSLNATIDVLNGNIDDLLAEIAQMDEAYQELLEQAEENYQIGVSDGMTEGETMANGLVSIFGAPMYVFGEVFDFEFLGLNILSLIKFILTISIIGYVVLKLRS